MIARRIALVLGIALTVGLIYGCNGQQKTASQPPTPSAGHSSPPGRLSLDAHRSLGTPKTFQNLTLIPVYDPEAKATNAYITLDEGLKAKMVKVREAEGGGTVNKLYITNRSKQPLYIMAGEVVLGGQQDRCLAEDTLIPSTEKEVAVTAFCVEHGRWSGERDFRTVAFSVASKDVRSSVQDGSFKEAARVANVSSSRASGVLMRDAGRAAIETDPVSNNASISGDSISADDVGSTQQKVWDKVEMKNRTFKTASTTGTYRTLLNAEAGEAQKSLAPYLKEFEKGLDSDPQLVGALVAINGKVVAADIFGDPDLFRRLWPKLLRSYASDAAEVASAPEAKKQTVVSSQMGKDFFASASDTKSKAVNKSKVSTTTRLDSKTALLYEFEHDEQGLPGAANGGGGGAGFGRGMAGGKGLHTNVIGK